MTGLGVLLQRGYLLLGALGSSDEGEIIRSSICVKFGAGCINSAGGAGICGHWMISGWAGGADEQPTPPIVHSSAQRIVFGLGMG